MIDPAAHVGLVRLVAARIARRIPGRPDPKDLWGDGYLGLVAAADRFDPAKGFAFSTYAVPRIEGAMRDGERARHGGRRRAPGYRRFLEAVSVELLIERAERRELATRDAAPQLPPDPARTDDALLAEDEVVAVRRALLALPPMERTVTMMTFFEDLTNAEIGAVFGLTGSRIAQIRTRALGRMRRQIVRRHGGGA